MNDIRIYIGGKFNEDSIFDLNRRTSKIDAFVVCQPLNAYYSRIPLDISLNTVQTYDIQKIPAVKDFLSVDTKNVYRGYVDEKGLALYDIITLRTENCPKVGTIVPFVKQRDKSFIFLILERIEPLLENLYMNEDNTYNYFFKQSIEKSKEKVASELKNFDQRIFFKNLPIHYEVLLSVELFMKMHQITLNLNRE